jgi:hypothetical protein
MLLISLVAVAAATVTTAAIASPTAVTTATRTIFARARFVNGQGTAVDFVTVEAANSFLRLFFGRHFDKPEPFGATRLTVGNHGGFRNFTDLFEQGAKIVFRRTIRKIANVQLLGHNNAPVFSKIRQLIGGLTWQSAKEPGTRPGGVASSNQRPYTIAIIIS